MHMNWETILGETVKFPDRWNHLEYMEILEVMAQWHSFVRLLKLLSNKTCNPGK